MATSLGSHEPSCLLFALARLTVPLARLLAPGRYVDRMLTRSFSARGQSALPADVPQAGPCSCCHAIDEAA